MLEDGYAIFYTLAFDELCQSGGFSKKSFFSWAERKGLIQKVSQGKNTKLKKIDGIKVYESNTNFIFMNYDKAVQLNEALEGQGIGIRSFGNAPLLTNCIRISMGTREENDVWLKAVMDFVEASV